MIKIRFTICLTFFCFWGFSQKGLNERPVIKANILNLFMQGPSIAMDIPADKEISIMPSVAYGKFDWGDVGGLRTYKSIAAEVRKHENDIYYGGYIKHTTKTVFREAAIVAGYIPISKDRNFKGHGLAVGASTGIEVPVKKRLNIDFNMQLGYGRFYKIREQFLYNVPSGNFIDFRLAFWIGYRLK